MSRVKVLVKKILPNEIKRINLLFYIIILSFCYLFFQHPDLFHTSSSSYAYLNGHIIDFYDYNKPLVGGNDYYCLIYVIFAIWNFPLKLFGLTHNVVADGLMLSIPELIWTKLLLLVFYFASAYIIYNISKLITNDANKSKLISAIFATSPIAVFAVFIFGQYDIISILFTLLGFYYYIQNDYLKFSIYFSFAISLKFFPIVIFIPLLLLIEKRILYILKYFGIAISITLIQILIYLNNIAFRERFFSLAQGKLSELSSYYLSPINSSSFLVIAFMVICLFAYIKKVNCTEERNRLSIFISLSSYAVLFSTVVWHPQWLIIMMPFFALSYIYVKDLSKSFIIDIIGTLSFIYIVANFFPNNVDANMLQNGVFRSFFTYIPLHLNQLYIPKFFKEFMGIFFLYLFSPLLVMLFQKRNTGKDEKSQNTYIWFNMRFYIGMALIVIPMLFCALAPKPIARKIDPLSYTLSGLSITQSDKPAGLINKGVTVRQSFIAGENKLTNISVQLATYARINKCNVTFELCDQNNIVIASQKIDGSKIVDNAFYDFEFNEIKNSKGRIYFLVIKSDGTEDNSITVWMSNDDVYPEGNFYINEEEVIGDMCFKLVYNY